MAPNLYKPSRKECEVIVYDLFSRGLMKVTNTEIAAAASRNAVADCRGAHLEEQGLVVFKGELMGQHKKKVYELVENSGLKIVFSETAAVVAPAAVKSKVVEVDQIRRVLEEKRIALTKECDELDAKHGEIVELFNTKKAQLDFICELIG